MTDATPSVLVELRPGQIEALEKISEMTKTPVDEIVQMATDDLIRGFARLMLVEWLKRETGEAPSL